MNSIKITKKTIIISIAMALLLVAVAAGSSILLKSLSGNDASSADKNNQGEELTPTDSAEAAAESALSNGNYSEAIDKYDEAQRKYTESGDLEKAKEMESIKTSIDTSVDPGADQTPQEEPPVAAPVAP